MSGGRRKSRKPQKWEDYVADEEQLATIEKELEKEEEARMQSVDNNEDNAEEVEDTTKKKSDDDNETTDDEAQLEIVIQKDEREENLKADGITDEENSEVAKVKADQEEEENLQPSIPGGNGQMIGDCTTCGIQLRDWSSTHNHLRFHRLSHVPECIYKVITPLSRRIVCQVCQRSCQNKEVLAYHAYTEHYINHKDAKICPFCSMSFKGMEEFQEHLDIDIISFKCQMCGVSVNQEHRFYQHTVSCTKKHQLGIASLSCCICGIKTTINKLYSHLMQHSTLLSLPRHLAHNNKRRAVNPPKPDPLRQQQNRCRPFLCEICDHRFVVYTEFKRHLYSHFKSRSYVCTHCGRSYCRKNTLIVHLYSYHNASPNAEEVIPKEETAQRSCELCGRSGFLNDEFLIRHCILRCSQRNNLQVSFAVIISNYAKNQNMGFTETLSSSAMHTYLKLGIEAWGTPLCVKQYLEELQTSNKCPGQSLKNRQDAAEFTDVQLLEYLDQYEEKNREQDKELEFLLNFKSKNQNKPTSVEKKKPEQEEIRNNIRKTLADCLIKRYQDTKKEFDKLKEDDIKILVEEIEKELYLFFGKDVGFKYKSRYRSIIFNARDTKNSGLFRKILNGSISPANLVRMTSEELASKELCEWLEREEKKGVDGSHLEFLQSVENMSSSNQVDMKPGADDLLTSSLYTNSSLETSSSNTSSSNCQIDFSRLMQHLRRGNDKRTADEEGGEGGQIDICLVTSTTNTQVTITPAGCHPHDIRPPKMARSVSHKPSVAEIQRIYPGVTVLSDVDFSRIPSLFFEMQEMMSDRIQREIEEAGINPRDLQRLEVESQLLREAEPFYLQDDPQWQILKCNGIMNGSSKGCNTIPNPAALARIIAETNDMYNGNNEERKYAVDCPYSGEDIDYVPSQADIARLFKEAQKLAV